MTEHERTDMTAGFKRGGCPFFAIVSIALGVFLVFSNTLDKGFVNYDDNKLIYENPHVKRISWENTKKIFTSPPLSLYYPPVIGSFNIEYALFDLNPYIFHFTDLLLHMANTLLVFWFIYLLSRRISVSFVGALRTGHEYGRTGTNLVST